MKHTAQDLIMLQALPLEVKVAKTKLRIMEWVDYWGEDKVYISFSGGKDSTVLLHLVREEFPNVKAVFSDTGLEYPEIKQFVKTFDNVEVVRADMTFKEVIEKKGYPVVSKMTSRKIRDLQNPTDRNETSRNLYLTGITSDGRKAPSYKLAEKWKPLIEAPFKVSEKCCDILKKDPLRNWEKKTKINHAMIGTMAGESRQRMTSYMKTGCNSYEGTGKSQPIGFWTEQDILQYIKQNNIKIASVYGDIIETDGKLTTTQEKRTGCVFCMFGVHLEKEPNRFQRMKKTHPKLHNYCMENLGIKEVLDFINVESE